ncbi:MAG: metallophosphoesterase family protein [Pseudomonadales bacterium]|nr:metallophosphoesterase family protein [Pseudomonadales bacterium]
MPVSSHAIFNTIAAITKLLYLIVPMSMTHSGLAQTLADRCDGQEIPTERMLLQQATPDSIIIKWRGEADSVCIGTRLELLHIETQAKVEGSHRVAKIQGLEPDTKYYYSIGSAPTARADHYFYTAPTENSLPADGNVRMWILGDSGTAAEIDEHGVSEHPGEAIMVKEGYQKFLYQQESYEPADLILLLGDNAYPSGTDEEWQESFFNIYPEQIRTTTIVPTIGNHEMGTGLFDACPIAALLGDIPGCDRGPVVIPLGGASQESDHMSYDSDGDGPDGTGMPYIDIFSLPSKGEGGGVPSGTEQYYSINFGIVHIVSLDSQLSVMDPDQLNAMKEWLVDDLEANQLPWTIVIFHHPPYSKGHNHDSDLEDREIWMRETINPVIDEYGVDVVYGGHAHSYERSWYLNGHYGDSNSFNANQHAELDADGSPAYGQETPYQQVSPSTGKDNRTIYTVNGSSGGIGGDQDIPCQGGIYVGCKMPDWLQHPAHRDFPPVYADFQPHGIERQGSVVLDANESELISRFVDLNGDVLDYFVIQR